MHAFIMLRFIYLQRTAVVNVFWFCRLMCFSGHTLTAWPPPSALWQTCPRCRGQCAAEVRSRPPGACSSTRWCRASASPAPSAGEVRHSNSHVQKYIPVYSLILLHLTTLLLNCVCVYKMAAHVCIQKGRWWVRKVPLSCRRAGVFPAPDRTWWWAEWTPEFSLSPWTQCQSYLCQKDYTQTWINHKQQQAEHTDMSTSLYQIRASLILVLGSYIVGIPWIWMGVGCTIPFFLRPFRIAVKII